MSSKELSSELLAGLQFFIASEGSTTHLLKRAGSDFFVKFWNIFLGASQPFLGRNKEEPPPSWFLSGQHLHYIFHCFRALIFDTSISLLIPLKSSRPWSDMSAQDRDYGLFLTSSLKISLSVLCLGIPYSLMKTKGVICNTDDFTFLHSFLRSLKRSAHVCLFSGRCFYFVSPVEKVASLFFENPRNSSVFVVVENESILITFCNLEELDSKCLSASVRNAQENAMESLCGIGSVNFEQYLWLPYKGVSTGDRFEEYSGEKWIFLVKADPPHTGWILGTSYSIPLASCRKQESDLTRIPAVDVLQEENEKDEVLHLVSNLHDEINGGEAFSLCLPRCTLNQTRPASHEEETLNSNPVPPPANAFCDSSIVTNPIYHIFSIDSSPVSPAVVLVSSSKNTDEVRGSGLFQIQTSTTESLIPVDELNGFSSASSSKIARLHAKLPERPSPGGCYLPNREEGFLRSEYRFSFARTKDDKRKYLHTLQSSIAEEEKLYLAFDPISDPQVIDASDSESSPENDCEAQCNTWDEDFFVHQNQIQDYSGECNQSIPGLSPFASSQKTDSETQTEDCFGPILTNLEEELAASQNMCFELQQMIKRLEEQLKISEEEKHKLQADLGRYLFLEEKEKRMSAMSVRRHELLGHPVSRGVVTDYDASCSFSGSSDYAVPVTNEASDHSHMKRFSGRKIELQEHAADSAQSVPTQHKSSVRQPDGQERDRLTSHGTSFTSSRNAVPIQKNDTVLRKGGADHEHDQDSSFSRSEERSDETNDDTPVSSMNAECNIPSFQTAGIANDYSGTSTSSSQSTTNSSICDSGLNPNFNEEKTKPLVSKGMDWKDENVEVAEPCAASGEERGERAVDFCDETVTAPPHATNAFAVNTVSRPSSGATDWERLGARPKQIQHSLVAQRPKEPLVSLTDGLAANFLARHTQDKALQDSLHQSTGTPIPFVNDTSHGTSYIDGYTSESSRATAYFGDLSFASGTDPHGKIGNHLSSSFRGEFDRSCIESDFSYEHLNGNTTDAPGSFDGLLGDDNFSRFRNYPSGSTLNASNSYTLQGGFVQNSQVPARNNYLEDIQNHTVLPVFNSYTTNTTEHDCPTTGWASVVRPSGYTTTFEDACLPEGSTHGTSILGPRYGDADSNRSSTLNNIDFGTDSVESSDNSLLALERRVADACALVERVLREREEREQFGREIERKEQLIREQRAKEKREREERELREAESWPQQQEAITVRSQWLCEHYQRHCQVRFPCCTQFYPCHRCHNISKACDNEEAKACHATHLKCSHCQHEQEIGEDSAKCRKCGGKMSAYFCAICKHFTSVDKNPYHCEKCGICRIHQDKSFHCEVCNVCLDKRLEGNHKCRPDSGHDECCICLEDAFSGCQILPCSHKVHRECAIAMIQNGIRTCPICRHPLYGQPRE